MKIAVFGGMGLSGELVQSNENILWVKAESVHQLFENNTADGYFLLEESAVITDFALPEKPVFINSVVNTLYKIKAPKNVIRINGWPGFIAKELWEVSGILPESAVNILSELGKRYINVTDEPGFISARVLAMIINEAYYAESENVSPRAEIDIAMKLGTNYPFGPFEWADIIGEQRIYELLLELSQTDKRYTPAAALAKSIQR